MLLENNVELMDCTEKLILGYYKLSNLVKNPKFATVGSAAFDVCLFFDGTAILAYDEFNREVLVDTAPDNKLLLLPHWRYKLPTGLIFDIPEGYRLDVNIRGGTGLKGGLCLANDTGRIDWDYIQELYVFVLNASKAAVLLDDGEKFAQIKLEKIEPIKLSELEEPPIQKQNVSMGVN